MTPLLLHSVAGQIYRSADKPNYLLGHAFSLACMVGGICVISLEYYIWKKRNAVRDAMTEEEKAKQDAEGVVGDHHHSFRYVL
jgi:hypothetical protein